MTVSPLTEVQLDALRELANIASGTAASALSQMLGREVEINVPTALALPLADAVDACGDPEQPITAVALPVAGDLDGIVLLLFGHEPAAVLCGMLGVEPNTEWGDSALQEIGNILGASYLNGLGAMTGLSLEPMPPALHNDMLGAIVATALAQTSGSAELALLLDSQLDIADEPCALSFMLLPTSGSITDLLAPLGLA